MPAAGPGGLCSNPRPSSLEGVRRWPERAGNVPLHRERINGMPLRRLVLGVPLASLVAVLAHVAGFGYAHAPGGDHATALLSAVAAALVALLAAGFVRAAVAGAPEPIATNGAGNKSALALAARAAVAFAAIEIAEGHSILAGVRPLLALVPLAFLVAAVTRRAAGFARRAGARVAAVYLRRLRARSMATFVERMRARVRAYDIVARHVARGRAPPRFA